MRSVSPPTTEILAALQQAHFQCAFRENPSSVAVRMVAGSGGSYTSAIAAALLTLGAVHGPLQQTQEFLEACMAGRLEEQVGLLLSRGEKIPGWGNSFVKGEHDRIWEPVRALLGRGWPDLADQIQGVTATLHTLGVNVYPNPSCYTAAVSIVMKVPARVCAGLFVSARISAWAQIFLEATK